MKYGYNFFCLILFIVFNFSSHAQPWLKSPSLKSKLSQKDFIFYDIQKAFNKYAEAYNEDEKEERHMEEQGEDEGLFPGYNQFKRWEWFTEQRVYPSGNYPGNETLWNEFFKFRNNQETFRNSNANSVLSGQWINLVSSTVATGGSAAGMGRINCMAFMRGNPNTIFIGAATGGVWKSDNNGASWVSLNTDQLPSMSIADIAINPKNTTEIYIATGDKYSGFPGVGKALQGHFSAGVLKSTDGGQTWNGTGISWQQNQLVVPQRLLMHPQNTDTLLVASFTGIWRTVDAGLNWLQVKAGVYYCMEFNPLNADIVYATDANGFWRSNNCGTTWTYKGGGYVNAGSVRVTLGISPADTNIIYLWGQGGAFKKYTSSTNTFITKTSPDPLIFPYGLYDRGVTVSPTNVQEIFVAGAGSAKSIDGGTSWNTAAQYVNELAADYIHQDVKQFYYKPGSSTTLYALTDGGIFTTTNSGTTWTNLSHGIQISEIYRISSHPLSADTVLYGTQDCATNRWTGSSSSITQIFGSDGMQSMFDYTNPMTLYICTPYGNLQRSQNGGQSYTLASPGLCLWVAPYVMNLINPQTMYIGARIGMKKSFVGGVPNTSWTTISTAPVLDSVTAVAVTIADTNVVYAAKYNKMVRSPDGGTNWVNISPGLPVNAAAITYIAVSNTDANKIYVTFSGYSAGNKVFISGNGGNTWNNYSGTILPNVPVNCITYVNNSNGAVYIGTDFGVFYRDASMADWIPFNTGLPNVIVNHLDIHYPSGKLRAGTYGRGLWETDMLLTGTLPVELASFTGAYNESTHANDLHWTTASEANSNYFEIMKSPNARYFSSIGKVIAAGNSTQPLDYNFSDNDVSRSIHYYYLRQVDFNGSELLSNTIAIRNGRAENTLVVFPNPAHDKIQFEFPFSKQVCDLELFDVMGKQIVREPKIKINTAANNTVDISFLSPGIYFIKISSHATDKFLYGRLVKK
ncbi:MAG TPA: T9SS type A sorting domain-containing protein [Bacteroidia bacterium]|nr:T9SS type A sorting domain-containing protein [Bacteroidia bacterium]